MRRLALPLAAPTLLFLGGIANAQIAASADYGFVADVPKFAIVISTSLYDDKQLETYSVANAPADAKRIADVLRGAQFDAITVENGTKQQILATIRSVIARQITFENSKGLRPLLVIFFAGHGFSVEGEDYVTGTDFDKENNLNTAIALAEIVDQVSSSADVIIFSDACRTKLSGSREIVGEAIDGTAGPPPTGDVLLPRAPDRPRGYASDEVRNLRSFATQKGRGTLGAWNAPSHRATDTRAPGMAMENSPYTTALSAHISKPGVRVRTALGRVYADVSQNTDLRQYPQVEDGGAASEEYYFVSSASAEQEADTEWGTALASGDPITIRYFVNEYGSSRRVAAARKWLRDHGYRN